MAFKRAGWRYQCEGRSHWWYRYTTYPPPWAVNVEEVFVEDESLPDTILGKPVVVVMVDELPRAQDLVLGSPTVRVPLTVEALADGSFLMRLKDPDPGE